MNTSDPDEQKKNPEYLHLNKLKLERKKKKDALNLYTEKNLNVLSTLFHRKIKQQHSKWTKNVLKQENKII